MARLGTISRFPLGVKSTIHDEIAKSSKILEEVVWPIIGRHIGGGYLSSAETSKWELPQNLDKHTGLDVFQVCNDKYRTIASRIGYGKDYRSFTIRLRTKTGSDETEYQKRCAAIDGDWMFPAFTLQAYVDDDLRFLSCAVIKTVELYAYLRSKPLYKHVILPVSGGNTQFIVARWDDIQKWTAENQVISSLTRIEDSFNRPEA
jgi:hypothetical protein